MLIDSMPDAMTELMRIATIGRSLGLHLVLATQRPQGTISQDIRANIATSICLRVASAQDSHNLLEHEAAAYISAAQPGAGYVRLPDGRSLAFRAPLTDGVPSEVQTVPRRSSHSSLRGGGASTSWRNHLGNTTGKTSASPAQSEKPSAQQQSPYGASGRHGISGTVDGPSEKENEGYCPIPEELPDSLPCRFCPKGQSEGTGICWENWRSLVTVFAAITSGAASKPWGFWLRARNVSPSF